MSVAVAVAVAIVTHTPFYVWILLAYLVWQGVKAARPQTVGLVRLLIVPTAFVALGIAMLMSYHADAGAMLAWGLALILFAPLGYGTGPRLLAVDPRARMVRRPGSTAPLVRNVTVFVLQYAVAVLTALHQDRHAVLFLVGRAVSGATAGYFVGWLLAFRQHYRLAPRLTLADA
jgi:hypothetical protein